MKMTTETPEQSKTSINSQDADISLVSKCLTTERVDELIRLLNPYLEHTVINIDHIGEFDKNGCKHVDAIAVINFNETHQITIWNDGIKYYNETGRSSPKDTSNEFAVYRLLHSWGFIS